MNSQTIKTLLVTIALVLFQVMVFNHVHLGKLVSILVYPLAVLLLPINTTNTHTILYAFFVGITIDIFSITGGIHAASLLTVALFKNGLVKTTLQQKDISKVTINNIKKIGVGNMLGFFVAAYFTHHFLVFLIEYWSFAKLPFVLLKTIVSTLLSAIISLIFAMFIIRKN